VSKNMSQKRFFGWWWTLLSSALSLEWFEYKEEFFLPRRFTKATRDAFKDPKKVMYYSYYLEDPNKM